MNADRWPGALELGRQLDVPLPSTATTNELVTAARGMGLEQCDFRSSSTCWRGCPA